LLSVGEARKDCYGTWLLEWWLFKWWMEE